MKDYLKKDEGNDIHFCSFCRTNQDQILLLSCAHDICLDCASTHYFRGNLNRNRQTLKSHLIYWCERCFEPTSISSQTEFHLSEYFKQKNGKKRQIGSKLSPINQKNQSFTLSRTKSFKSRDHLSNQNDIFHDYLPVSDKQKHNLQIKHQKLPNEEQFRYSFKSIASEVPTEQKIKEIQTIKKANSSLKHIRQCKQHEDEYQVYYCFTCLENICVQCALHGAHIGHEVEAVRKCGKKLKAVFSEVLEKSEKYKINLKNILKEKNGVIDEFTNWNINQKNKIKERFAQILEILKVKEKILLQKIDFNLSEGIKKLNNEKKIFSKIFDEVKNLHSELSKNLEKNINYWDITEVEAQKALINNLLDTKPKGFGIKSSNLTCLNYLDSSLVIQGIKIVEELVNKFKFQTLKTVPSQFLSVS